MYFAAQQHHLEGTSETTPVLIDIWTGTDTQRSFYWTLLSVYTQFLDFTSVARSISQSKHRWGSAAPLAVYNVQLISTRNNHTRQLEMVPVENCADGISLLVLQVQIKTKGGFLFLKTTLSRQPMIPLRFRRTQFHCHNNQHFSDILHTQLITRAGHSNDASNRFCSRTIG